MYADVLGFRQFMLVVVVLHCHAKGFCRFFVREQLQVAKSDDFAVSLVGHTVQYAKSIFTIEIVEVYLYGAEFFLSPTTIVIFFLIAVETQRFAYRHLAFRVILLVAIIQTCCLEPTGQCTLAFEILHLAFACSFAWCENYDVYLVYELFAGRAICIVVVVDGLEEGVASLVEILASDQIVSLYQGFGYLQVFIIYSFYFHVGLSVINNVYECAGDIGCAYCKQPIDDDSYALVVFVSGDFSCHSFEFSVSDAYCLAFLESVKFAWGDDDVVCIDCADDFEAF